MNSASSHHNPYSFDSNAWSQQARYLSTRPASADTSIGANCPARNFGYAAAAIIAALSVDSGREGKFTAIPRPAAANSNAWRSSLLAATPPVTNKVATLQAEAAAKVLETRSSTTDL